MRFDQLAAATGGTLYNSEAAARRFRGVAIDSRAVSDGQLFFAIKGERFDGHDFVPQALERGAAGVVAANRWPRLEHVRGDVAVVAVPDTHEAMMVLARAYRESLAARFVGVTGSNGKTTTKEFIFSLLQALADRIYRSRGNLNNLYGVPLALFGAPRDTALAVIEMGISTPTEMPQLVAMVQPDVAVVTNVGPSHLQFLDSVDEVARAKLEILRSRTKQVTVVVNADDPVLMKHLARYDGPVATFGLEQPADFTAEEIITDDQGCATAKIEGRRFRLPLPGRHQVANLLAAYAAVRTLGFDFEGIDTESIALGTAPMRGEMVECRGVRIVADCYNANPESIKAGLATFFAAPASGRRVLILGDMLELGRESNRLHEETGRLLAEYRFDLAVLVGPQAKFLARGAAAAGVSEHKLHLFPGAAACAAEIDRLVQPGDTVFIKGSRGVGLEKVLTALGHAEEKA